MTQDVLLVVVIVVLAVALTTLGLLYARTRRHTRPLRASARRILFPFAGRALSQRALDAALRLARAEDATLVPAFLARVPMRVPLEGPLPRQCSDGMPLLEAVEQRAVALGVPVDARVARGRTYRHALRDLIEHERYDRIVVAAAGPDTDGFHGGDIAWLLDTAPGEVVIVRPDHEDAFHLGWDRRHSPSEPPSVKVA
jgi:nucleotide-binding universal stress UspA family protein